MASSHMVDINTATVDELEKLSGIGRCKAEAIVSHREGLGGFSSILDLKKVLGVGHGVLEQNKGILTCATSFTTPTGKRIHSRSLRNNSGKAEPLRVNLRSSSDGGPSSSRPRCPPSTSRSKTSKGRGEDATERASLPPHPSSSDVKTETPNTSNHEDFLRCICDADQSTSHASRDSSSSSPESRESLYRCADDSNDESDEERDVFLTRGHGALSPYRSRIPVPVGALGNHVKMKRKIGREDLGISPGKRLCRIGELKCSSHSCVSGLHPFSSLKVPRMSNSVANIRRKIPSKDHPPPELADWLQTFTSWSNAERLMALDHLIQLCEPTQVRHMMQVIEPQFQRDFISLLPKELALYVLSFLDPKDLLRAAQTCRYWRLLAEDNLLWREKCREEDIDESLVFGNRRRRGSQGTPRSPWKVLYMRQYQIEQNWRNGQIRPSKVLKGHDDHVITCLEFCGSRIVSGSDDNTLKVWSSTTGKCLRTLVGHTGGVWSSQMEDNVVISGSTDRTLKVWNAETGQCVHTLYGHTSTVRCMHLHNSKVVSGSRDATLRVWDIDTGGCLHVLMGHVAAVRCVQYDGRRVVSGAYDYMVKVWDPETESCLHTLQGHTNRVYSLQFDGVHIVSGSLDTSIRVWDVETGNCLHTLIGHQSLTSGMELKHNTLVSGNADSTVKVWDITTGQCLQTLQGPNKHQSAVTCLQFNKKFVITSSDDGTVKIWDLRTGDFLRNLVSLDSGGSGGVVWRVRCSNTKLVCAVGSRNGTEETKLLVLDFDVEEKKLTL